jgi:hypothetical protein
MVSLLILKISFVEIKGKMYKLLIRVQISNLVFITMRYIHSKYESQIIEKKTLEEENCKL